MPKKHSNLDLNKKSYFTPTGFTVLELSMVLIIIGSLLAIFSVSSYVIDTSRLTSARAKTNNSPIVFIDGLAIWLETTSKDSILESEAMDGGDVTTWTDINPKAPGTLSFTTPATAPNYVRSAMNNLPALEFNGSSDYMSGLSDRFSATEDFSIFMVASFDSVDIGIGTQLLSIQDGTGNGKTILNKNTSDQLQSYLGGQNTTSSTAMSFAQAEIYNVNHDSGTITLYQNGVETASESRTMTPADGNLVIAVHKNVSSYFQGYIGEIIVFSRDLKTSEREAVESYLANKWNVNLN